MWSEAVPESPNFGIPGLSLKREKFTNHPISSTIAISGVLIMKRSVSDVRARHYQPGFIRRSFDLFSLLKDLPVNPILPFVSNPGYNFILSFLKDPQHKKSFCFLR